MDRDHIIYNARNDIGSLEFAEAVVNGEPYQNAAQQAVLALLDKGWTLLPPPEMRVGLPVGEPRVQVDHLDGLEVSITVEPVDESAMVNGRPFAGFGDGLTGVSCTAGEWSGTKADLAPRDGVPLCPNGHPLFEGGERWQLGVVLEITPHFGGPT